MKKQCERSLNYGIIGNCRSGALVSDKGAIEWLCLPKFDSSSVFGKLLDEEKGGSFEILPETEAQISQKYDWNTNILITRFTCTDGIFEVHDFMPRYKLDNGNYYMPPDVIRYFKHIEGAPTFRITYDPRLEYSKHPTQIDIYKSFVKAQTAKGNYDSMYLYSSMNISNVVCRQLLTLTKDEFVLLSYNQKLLKQTVERSYTKLSRTKAYWLTWAERTTRFGKYNDAIARSALVLKLLSYQKSGAILAALTTSLPETVGEVRNWDYRFCWIRDASMVIKVMTSLDHYNLANDYLRFITDLLPEKDERIQIMYGINGEKKLTEETLDHLSGYCHSAPVRTGNAAYKQKQNDIYGILMDVIYQHFQLFSVTLEHSEELWTITRNMVRAVERNWKRPDKGIWEMRQNDRHFTFSKVLCWVAVDRAIKIASLLQQRDQAEAWMPLREKIKQDILTKAWNEEKQAFTQAYGVADLDASVLQMEFYGFIAGKDPQFVSTVKAIQKELGHKDLMFRYRNKDDFGEPSSAFTICSFWLVRALYMIGEEEEARKKFDQLLSYSNHLGLFSEDLDFETKRLLGNFPQAYSHLALIDTAMLLAGGKLSKEELLLQIIH
ncbi:glycoside hydrolase family 15 protein [Geofilum rhodophaeum]|uniref:glycoside hydrolase family 15 protein n=1 Tax=Geofilum rhodophaeum TaxID=1965019 RepID=UPI000B5248CE|nr:glycoside hydrolase family 15 protein [Geofilum rhodophaeum]